MTQTGTMLEVRAKELAEAVRRACLVVPKKTAKPILENVVLRHTPVGLTVTGTDLETWVRTSVYCVAEPVPAPIDYVVDAGTLLKFLKTIKDGWLRLESDERSLTMTTNDGKRGATLVRREADEYPTFPEIDEKGVHELEPVATPDLFDRLRGSLKSVTREPGRYAMHGVAVHPSTGMTVSTDGRRLFIARTHEENEGSDFTQPWLVSSKTIKTLVDAIKVKKRSALSESRFRVGFVDGYVRFADATTTVVGKLMDGEFPKYQAVVAPRSGLEHSVPFSRADLVKAIEAVLPLCGVEARAATFEFAKGKPARIVASTPNGDAHADVDDIVRKIDSRFALNPDYVLDALSVLTEDDVLVCWNDRLSPIQFVEYARTVVIMPITIDEA